MTTIVTSGRSDLTDLFKLSGVLEGELRHNPFLAFAGEPDSVTVHVVSSAEELVAGYAPETPVMVQWPGRWRSDFFKLTVADVARGLERKRQREERDRQKCCSLCAAVADGYQLREDDLGWLKVCRSCVAAYDAEHPRTSR